MFLAQDTYVLGHCPANLLRFWLHVFVRLCDYACVHVLHAARQRATLFFGPAARPIAPPGFGNEV